MKGFPRESPICPTPPDAANEISLREDLLFYLKTDLFGNVNVQT